MKNKIMNYALVGSLFFFVSLVLMVQNSHYPLTFAISNSTETTTSFSNVFEKAQKSAVMVTNVPNMTSSPFNNNVGPDNPLFSSGFVYDNKGHIVTSDQAISTDTYNTITIYNGSTYPAELVGTDPISDVAVLQLSNASLTDLVSIPLANSSEVKVGQEIATLVSPFGIQNLLYNGIIIGTNHFIYHDPQRLISNVFFTNIPIFFGYSGGPVLNTNGQLVGVNIGNSTYSTNFNIGSVLSSNMVDKIVSSLIQNGTYHYPWLGYTGSTLSPSLAESFGLPSNYGGILVEDVVPNGPADKAGLQGMLIQGNRYGEQQIIDKDIIIAVDERPVSDNVDIMAYYDLNKKPGDNITLTINRNGQILKLNATLDSTPQIPTDINSLPDLRLPDMETNNLQTDNIGSAATSPITIIPGTSFYQGENFYIIGEVKNNLDITMNWVEVGITLYDENNRIIGTSSTFPNPNVIPPLGSTPFKFSIGPTDVSSVNAIKDWRITASYR